MSDDHEHHAHIETPAPFLFCIATAIMFIGLVMATAGGEDKTGDTGYWFVFILGIMGMFTAFFMWIQDYWDQESEEDEHIETYHSFWATISTRKIQYETELSRFLGKLQSFTLLCNYAFLRFALDLCVLSLFRNKFEDSQGLQTMTQ